MYNTDLKFHSDRKYPAIISSGSTSFTKTSSGLSINLSPASVIDNFLVYEESGGWRIPIVAPNFVYLRAGRIYCYLNDFDSRSGVIKWRLYGA